MLASLVLGGLSNLTFAADCVNGVNLVTCTVPAGITSMQIAAWGGGGGGATALGIGMGTGAGGGGGGSYCGATFSVTPGSTLTVTLGTGGAASGNGGQTTVTGPGVVGLAANGGTGSINPFGGTGGTTAACTAVGATAFSGGTGSDGDPFGIVIGGGGGGSATNTAPGAPGMGPVPGAGEGMGGQGATTIPNTPAMAGNTPGGGGGGGVTAQGFDIGANGADGRVVMAFVIPAASPASIPTLSEWGMIILSSLLALGAAFTLRRQRR